MVVRVRLPPEGFLASSMASLALLFAAKYHRSRYLKVSLGAGDVLEFEGDVQDFCRSLQAGFSEILNEAPMPASPRIHQNDRKPLSETMKTLNLKPVLDATYTEIFKNIVEAAAKKLSEEQICRDFARDLSSFNISSKVVELGVKALAPLQVLKTEKYEYGRDYLRLAGFKADLRLSPTWITLAAAGWLASYIGSYMVKQKRPRVLALLYSMPSDEHILEAFMEASAMERVVRPGTLPSYWHYYSAPSKIRHGDIPSEAFLIQLALSLPVGDLSIEAGLPPLRLLRVVFDRKRFTTVEDTLIDLSIILPFARKAAMEPRLVGVLKSLTGCTLQSYSTRPTRECKDLFGDLDNMVRMVKTLYLAAIRSLRPESATYMLARLSPPVSEEKTPPFRNPWILRNLIEALT